MISENGYGTCHAPGRKAKTPDPFVPARKTKTPDPFVPDSFIRDSPPASRRRTLTPFSSCKPILMTTFSFAESTVMMEFSLPKLHMAK